MLHGGRQARRAGGVALCGTEGLECVELTPASGTAMGKSPGTNGK